MVLSESFVSKSIVGTEKEDDDDDDEDGKKSDTLGDSSSKSVVGDGESGSESNSGSRSLDRSLGIKSSSLTIIRTTPRDAGLYTCRGESRAGSVAANFSLVVLQNKAENLAGKMASLHLSSYIVAPPPVVPNYYVNFPPRR